MVESCERVDAKAWIVDVHGPRTDPETHHDREGVVTRRISSNARSDFMTASLRQLRIFFRDEDLSDIVIPIPECGSRDFLSLGSDQPVALPNGERIDVYAEVAPDRTIPDVSLSIVEDDRVFAVRGGLGVVVTYTTKGGLEVLLQVGTGAWEE